MIAFSSGSILVGVSHSFECNYTLVRFARIQNFPWPNNFSLWSWSGNYAFSPEHNLLEADAKRKHEGIVFIISSMTSMLYSPWWLMVVCRQAVVSELASISEEVMASRKPLVQASRIRAPVVREYNPRYVYSTTH
jgi:hypothetical protein